MNINYHLYN